MKKVYYIVFAVTVIIFAYFIIKSIPDVTNKVITVGKHSLSNSAFSETGNFSFKSTPERSDFLGQVLLINLDFINTPPIEYPKETNTIKNFYILEKFFPDFKYYYTSKLKIEKILSSELPALYSETSSLSNSELNTYFNNNIENLTQKWGITDLNEFIDIVSTLKELNGKNIISSEIEESYFYLTDKNLLTFRIILNLEDANKIYLSVQEYMYGKDNNSQTPEIIFYGTMGGQSYV